MLDCDRFPQDNDLCIPLASSDHLLPATEEGKPSSLLHPTTSSTKTLRDPVASPPGCQSQAGQTLSLP